MILTIVVICIAMVWLWFRLKNKHENEGELEVPKDVWTPTGDGGDVSTALDMTEGTSTEPMNGDPAVLTPAPENKPDKILPDLTPKFKVGDKITNGETVREIVEVRKVCYVLDNGEFLPINEQDQWKIYAPDPEPDPNTDALFQVLFVRFNAVVPVAPTSQTYRYLWECVCFARDHANELRQKRNIPTIYDYYGEQENKYAELQMCAWLMAMILVELDPVNRQRLYQVAYSFGDGDAWFGCTFETDPHISRWLAAMFYSVTRNDDIIPTLREELGTRMIAYFNDISELFLDLPAFLPGYPKDAKEDRTTRETVARFYNLDTSDDALKQRTVQAIADKEYKKPHLFGPLRTVVDPKYGPLWFNPVFGKHNIGVEIPADGAIAKFAYAVGKAATDNRKSLLDEYYGRHRPGQGAGDPSAAKLPKERALVNYAIEDGDGRKTGYYDQNGDYVDDAGNHIGDYEQYFQGQLYANSYPSGHSAYIAGVASALLLVMKDKVEEVLRAMCDYANSRMICRYHLLSDTTMGRTIGTMMLPVLMGCTNFDGRKLLKDAIEEYERLLKGDKPEPVTKKVNTSLAYSIGGYGSCHVDAGEKSLNHYCNKECNKDRHPSITLNQRVNYTIEGGGMTTTDGKTSGVWYANVAYGFTCPKVPDGEERVAVITMWNDEGYRILNYKLSRRGTHDDGTSPW